MDIRLILGPNDSGKSLYAENLAVQSGDRRIYLATMIPHNEENLRRIKKHRIQRQNKGFSTIESGWNIHKINVDEDSVVLLEDASNLLANGIFDHGANASQALDQILQLACRCKTLIIVTISGLTADGYDKETEHYIHELNHLNEQLLGISGVAVELENGIAKSYFHCSSI